jgi:hypothetical protein
MKYRVEIVYTIEADWMGEAAEQVQKAIEDGVPRHFALSIRPIDLEGNPGHGIERLVGPVDADPMARLPALITVAVDVIRTAATVPTDTLLAFLRGMTAELEAGRGPEKKERES